MKDHKPQTMNHKQLYLPKFLSVITNYCNNTHYIMRAGEMNPNLESSMGQL